MPLAPSQDQTSSRVPRQTAVIQPYIKQEEAEEGNDRSSGKNRKASGLTLSARMGTEILCKSYISVRCDFLLNNSLNCRQVLGQQATNSGKQLFFSA